METKRPDFITQPNGSATVPTPPLVTAKSSQISFTWLLYSKPNMHCLNYSLQLVAFDNISSTLSTAQKLCFQYIRSKTTSIEIKTSKRVTKSSSFQKIQNKAFLGVANMDHSFFQRTIKSIFVQKIIEPFSAKRDPYWHLVQPKSFIMSGVTYKQLKRKVCRTERRSFNQLEL